MKGVSICKTSWHRTRFIGFVETGPRVRGNLVIADDQRKGNVLNLEHVHESEHPIPYVKGSEHPVL